MKKMIMIVTTLLAFSTLAQAKEQMAADAQAVNAACSSDAATAKCEGEKVGTGLLKCLHTYKKANPTYKFAEGCKSAMKTWHEEKKQMKATH